MITVTRQDGVPDYALKAAEELFAHLETECPVKRRLKVVLWHASTYPSEDGTPHWAQYNSHPKTIHAGALKPPGVSKAKWLRIFLNTLGHEFKHYLQDCAFTENKVDDWAEKQLKQMGL